jgi:hypothetical protein
MITQPDHGTKEKSYPKRRIDRTISIRTIHLTTPQTAKDTRHVVFHIRRLKSRCSGVISLGPTIDASFFQLSKHVRNKTFFVRLWRWNTRSESTANALTRMYNGARLKCSVPQGHKPKEVLPGTPPNFFERNVNVFWRCFLRGHTSGHQKFYISKP